MYDPMQLPVTDKPASNMRQRISAGLIGAGRGMLNGGGFAGGAASAAEAVMGLVNQDRMLRQQQAYRMHQGQNTAAILNTAGSNGQYTPEMFYTLSPEQQVAFITAQKDAAERNAAGSSFKTLTGIDGGNMPTTMATTALPLIAANNKDLNTLSRAKPSMLTGGGMAVNQDVQAPQSAQPPQAAPTGQPMPQAPAAPVLSGLSPMEQMAVKALDVANKRNGTAVAPHDFLGMLQGESSWNPKAVSQTGNKGLGQLSDQLISHYGITNPYDAQQNVMGAANYLTEMAKSGKGSINNAIAGYFGGPGGQKKYMRGQSFSDPNIDVGSHINKVAQYAKGYKEKMGGKTTKAAPSGGQVVYQAPAAKQPVANAQSAPPDVMGQMNKTFNFDPAVVAAHDEGRGLNPFRADESVADPKQVLEYLKTGGELRNKNEDQSTEMYKTAIDQQRADQTGEYNRGLLKYMNDNLGLGKYKVDVGAAQPTREKMMMDYLNNASPQERQDAIKKLFGGRSNLIESLLGLDGQGETGGVPGVPMDVNRDGIPSAEEVFRSLMGSNGLPVQSLFGNLGTGTTEHPSVRDAHRRNQGSY